VTVAGHWKVFGIGLSKTGTTSLANALQILGYRTRDNMGVVRYAKDDLSSVDLGTVEAFDALTDTPIPTFYRHLDARFPGSKFILTVRDTEGWLKSCKKQFTQRFADVQTEAHKRLFLDLYGTDVFDERRFAAGYERFVGDVREYFKNRPDDLLIIDVTAGEGWDKLCAFLGRPIPEIPFPKANVTRIRWMGIDEIVAIARQAGMELMWRYDGIDRPDPHAGSALFASVRDLIARARRIVLREDRVQGAVRASNRAIVEGLIRLNPQIPVLSRAVEPVPYEARKDWNHFWLIDPLDGESAFANGHAAFSIDVALIEDGAPIYGVVYAPATDTVYYGSIGKGAYHRERGRPDPERLSSLRDMVKPSSANAGTPVAAAGARGEGSSRALRICNAVFGSVSEIDAAFEASMEWEVAAVHAILSCAGMEPRDGESGRPLGYNKKDLVQGCIKVESAELERTE